MVVDKLIELLETFEYPVIRQGSLGPDEAYPDTFFTFWSPDDSEHSAYDNEEALVEWIFNVNVYSTDVDKTYGLLDEARALLKSAGFTATTRGYDAASDEITHTGRGMVVAFIATENI